MAGKAKAAGYGLAALIPFATLAVGAWQQNADKRLQLEAQREENEQERFRLEMETGKVMACIEDYRKLAHECARRCEP